MGATFLLLALTLTGGNWRGGTTLMGLEQPFGTTSCPRDLAEMSFCNPCAPLLLSDDGSYVWSDEPFTFAATNGTVQVTDVRGPVERVKAGTTLREAYLAAQKAHFPPSGKMPRAEFFEKPQYNTWIESCLTTNTQEMVEGYADAIVSNRMPCGVLMIDAGWSRYGGDLEFNERFPRPKELFASIRAKGMRSMLWISPYVGLKSRLYRETAGSGLYYKNQATGKDGLFTYYWGNPEMACIDLTRRENWRPVRERFERFLREYGVDGFKFDFTDAECLRRHLTPQDCIPKGTHPVDGTGAWGDFAAWGFPFHELRAGWKFGGKPLVVRLQDKGHTWNDLRQIVPDMIAAGLLGCPFVCPDMIGGGSDASFRRALDRRLFVRSCQAQALMPMMQFSCAPWRVLDAEGLAVCRAMSELHVAFAPYILECAAAAAKTGEPIVRAMEYAFPHQGFETCRQQYMLGEEILVAPVVSEDDSVTVRLPAGRWKDDQGAVHDGPKTLELKRVPLSRLPYFRMRNGW